jgi:hypothetical protein
VDAGSDVPIVVHIDLRGVEQRVDEDEIDLVG